MKNARHFVFLLALFPLASAWAAINPESFTKGHPEKVRITILASHVVPGDDLSRVVLLAKVDAVEHSESGLRPGDRILVAYEQNHKKRRQESRAMKRKLRKGLVGPQVLYYPPALEAGDSCLAHLARMNASENNSGAVYAPRGYQYAFTLEDE